jgi:hypothetical protein
MCAGGYLLTLKVLLKENAEIDIRDDDDMTPLMFAALAGHEDSVWARHLTMALHYLNALSALYDYVLCNLTALSHCTLFTVCTAGPSRQACQTVLRVPSLEQCSSESRCEKRLVYPHSASVLK